MKIEQDAMYVYVWDEMNEPNECKFGERWVRAGQDPEKEIEKRVKSSLGVRKDRYIDGSVKIKHIWDVSEYAKKIGKFYKQSRVDDSIRGHIGHRKGSTGEVHTISAQELTNEVNKFLIKNGQPLPVVGLTANQSLAAENVLAAMESSKRYILAELCARFGKTIWSGTLIRETETPLTIITSYVLTSFTSFENDLGGFEQFKDFVLVDTSKDDYQEIINEGLSVGKQVVTFLSMCPGSKRQERINYLFEQKADRLIIIDEADFGAHKPGQSEPLLSALQDNDTVVIMTGTNGDKAASIWPIDHYLSVTYPELIMEKRTLLPSYTNTLKYFDIDPSRHDLTVDVEFYQMDLTNAVEFARRHDPELFVEDGQFLPSWSKFAANPNKAKGFWTRILQSVFEGKHGHDELNIDYQTNKGPGEGNRVSMMFLSGAIRTENLIRTKELASDALPSYEVVLVVGGKGNTTNRKAEKMVKEAIEKADKERKNVLILSAGMAQRSFSIPRLTDLFLAYDGGDNGATIQKMSRPLTPYQSGKIGRVTSLSFNPNRDDKFDSIIIETALNYKRNHQINSAKEALRNVLRTVDIFRCSEDGRLKVEIDDYLEKAIARKSLSRVVGKVANLSMLTPEQLKAIAAGSAAAFRASKVEETQKGKTSIAQKKDQITPKTTKEDLELLARAREVIAGVVENLDVIICGTGAKSIIEAFEVLSNDIESRLGVEEELGVDFDLIFELFKQNIINNDLVELYLDK